MRHLPTNHRFSRWDGTQKLPLDPDEIIAALADDLIEYGDLRWAMRGLMSKGMQIPQGGYLQGLRDMLKELRERRRARLERFDLSSIFEDLRERLDEKHDGGRAAWAGVALAWSGDSAKKGLTGALGGWLMGKNVALVGVALALVGTLVWLGRGGPLSEPGTGMVFDDSSAQFDGNRETLEEPQDIEAPPIPPPSDTGAAGRGEGEEALAAQGSTPSGAGAKPKEPEVEPPSKRSSRRLRSRRCPRISCATTTSSRTSSSSPSS